MKIVVNRCYGGFSVSRDVVDILKEKGYKIVVEGETYPDGSIRTRGGDFGYYLDNEIFNIKSDNYRAYRSNKDLIDAIEKIGIEKAGGSLAELEIVEIPDGIDWKIEGYDGVETIHEKHRIW